VRYPRRPEHLFCGASVCHDTIAAAFTIAEYFSNLSDILMLVGYGNQSDSWMSAGNDSFVDGNEGLLVTPRQGYDGDSFHMVATFGSSKYPDDITSQARSSLRKYAMKLMFMHAWECTVERLKNLNGVHCECYI